MYKHHNMKMWRQLEEGQVRSFAHSLRKLCLKNVCWCEQMYMIYRARLRDINRGPTDNHQSWLWYTNHEYELVLDWNTTIHPWEGLHLVFSNFSLRLRVLLVNGIIFVRG